MCSSLKTDVNKCLRAERVDRTVKNREEAKEKRQKMKAVWAEIDANSVNPRALAKAWTGLYIVQAATDSSLLRLQLATRLSTTLDSDGPGEASGARQDGNDSGRTSIDWCVGMLPQYAKVKGAICIA
ncbi:hypothetical protein LTR53_013462 [Teratosphaeriaceae sp. CCFEE 6253]|nr:hypothetical protein LTR53_013462 [Teratosphaeriaceae sp. CCFEE 6253]